MPEYLAPGVFIEEIEIGGKPIEGVSTSTAGFLGITERGPIRPMLITSQEDYKRIFGGYLDNSFLTYAIDGFFNNGGKRCFVGRVIDKTAATAQAFVLDGAAPKKIILTALGPGTWGNEVSFLIEKPTQQDGANSRFAITITYTPKSHPDGKIVEKYDNISTDPKSNSFYRNSINGISNFVVCYDNIAPTDPTVAPPAVTGNAVPLAGGTAGGNIDETTFDGYENDVTDPANNNILVRKERTGLSGFEELDDISIVCIPDEEQFNGALKALSNKIIDHCEKMKYRFGLCQTARNDISNIPALLPIRDTKYAALYFPMINVFDPLTKDLKLVPPGGHVAGIFARTDIERGVHKAPANVVVRGALSLQMNTIKGVQEILNPRGVNVFRTFQGRGIVLYGARTMSIDPLWKYVNVRRLFNFIERSIDEGTQYLVFEPNSERLWSRVIATIKQFLTQVWHDGALMGTTPEEAFFVKCDRTIMTQNDIDNGRLIVLIGIAPVKPAEFVIFRFAQTKAGTEVTEF